jgi:two-component system nitrogen regulation response regulator GlnG
MPTLLVVDDEPAVCCSFRRTSGSPEVLTEGTAAGLERFRAACPDVALDLQLPGRSGLDLFADIHAPDPKRPVVFITAHAPPTPPPRP